MSIIIAGTALGGTYCNVCENALDFFERQRLEHDDTSCVKILRPHGRGPLHKVRAA